MVSQRKNAGRPKVVDGGEATSVWLGGEERRVVALAAKHHLGSNSTANRSRIIRQMIRTSWERDREDLKEGWKKDLIIADLQAKLQAAEEKAERLQTELQRARRPKGKKSATFDLLMQYRVRIQERAAAGLRTPMGHVTIDQFWYTRGSSWAALSRDVERAHELGVWPLPKEEVAQ